MPRAPKWPPLTKARLVARGHAYCPHCGAVDGLTVQHRAVKGAGGRNSAERPSNGLLLCGHANWAAEADPGFAEYARACGWKVSTHADPSTVPYWDAVAGCWYLLGDTWDPPRVVPPSDHSMTPPQ